jgi:hypothetical protein
MLRHARRCLFLGLVLCGCTEAGPGPAIDFARAEPAWLAGNAANALLANGRLDLGTPALTSRQIDEATARAQALAWARLIPRSIGNIEATMEGIHGGQIDWTRLTACDRVYYVVSSMGTVPEDAPPWIHNGLGPDWLVRLCDLPKVPIVLGVAVNSDLTIVDGRLQMPAFNSGGWFLTHATPPGELPQPLEPESAIGFAFRTTGERITEVPTLMQRNHGDGFGPVMPQCSYWEIVLEHPVRGVGAVTGDGYETSRIRVGKDSCAVGDTSTFVALHSQPDTAVTFVTDVRLPDGTWRTDTIRVPLRIPYRFEPLLIIRP